MKAMWWIFFHFFFLFLFLVFDHHKSFLSWKKWEPKALSCYSAGHKEELDEEPPSTFWSFSDMKGKIGEFTYCMSKYVSESERSTKWPVLLSRWHVSFEVQSHSWNCSEIFSMAKQTLPVSSRWIHHRSFLLVSVGKSCKQLCLKADLI